MSAKVKYQYIPSSFKNLSSRKSFNKKSPCSTKSVKMIPRSSEHNRNHYRFGKQNGEKYFPIDKIEGENSFDSEDQVINQLRKKKMS